MKELAIVILQHDTPGDVENNLRKLKKTYLPGETEIVVVNNGGGNANEKINKSSYGGLNVRFYDIPNKGFPNGNNFGIAKTDSKYIAMVNPDIEVRNDTFKVLLEYMENNPRVGITAPQLIFANGKIQDNYRVFPRFIDLIIKRTPFLRKTFKNRMRKYLMWDKNPEKNEPVDWVTGAFQLIRKDCWDKIGPNSEDYFLFMSDLELCRLAWENGFEVHFTGKAKALHNEARLSEGTLMDIFRKKSVRIHLKDAMKYFKKFFLKKLPPEIPSKMQKR